MEERWIEIPSYGFIKNVLSKCKNKFWGIKCYIFVNPIVMDNIIY